MNVASRNSLIKRVVLGVCVIAAVWAVGCALIYSEMTKPPEEFGRFMARIPGPVAFLAFPFETLWTHARAGKLQVGDMAPDFTLLKIDKSESVRLASLNQTHPVVLVFGSYT